jgi:RHS repeat-associated protein
LTRIEMGNNSAETGQTIALPKGGGALHGIGEKFSPDLHTGTGNFTIPVALPPGRNGFQPQLNLVYSTGNGNGPFGLGWNLSIPGVSRKTSKGIPRYDDGRDVFILSGAEDLVPVKKVGIATHYRPRTEGLFAEIRYHRDPTNSYWEVCSKDGLVSTYGTQASFGSDPAAIADPSNPGKIFAWKLTSTEDSFHNRIEYEYERDRGEEGPHHWDQLYLARIRYVDYVDDQALSRFLVNVDFVYEQRPDDPHSEYRSGFEIRTRKRCARIVVSTDADKLQRARSYELTYLDGPAQKAALVVGQLEDAVHLDPSNVSLIAQLDAARVTLHELQAGLPLNGASLLSQVKVIGHDGDETETLPPLEFRYTNFELNRRDFFPLQGSDLPARSLANPDLELVDIFGNGLPDLLEMNGTVRYWRNLGNGRFDLPRFMQDSPAGLTLSDGGVQFVDANGDGRTDLLVTNSALSGYFPLSFDGKWDRRSFQRYRQAPSFNLKDPEVKLVDLDGDGVTDAIRSGTRLECFFNDAQAGWNNTRFVERQAALAVFPNINFSDPRVKWADITGDGLQDIALVYDGNIEYWPNLGRGDWGKRVHMENSPRFPFGYDPRRILIGDVDGDGLADIVYVDDTKVTLWINQSGNRWSDTITIEGTPSVSDIDAVRLVDILGSGISGVLWSRDANGLSREHVFFLDFTGGLKPYLLHEMDNHIGAVTKVDYAPSTRFYLEDQKRPGTRWKTTLPFPVHVVSRVEVIDHFSKGKLTTEYQYHHGYWDGAEREFRGFGRVEQYDTESFEDYAGSGLHGEETTFAKVERQNFSPPTLTKTWFHQGPVGNEFGDWEEMDRSDEYWPGDPQLLKHTEVVNQFLRSWPPTPDGRRIKRDALRTLRGSVLRTESYARDGSDREQRPYTVSESSFGLVEIEPLAEGDTERLRIFFPHSTSQRTTQWERGDDPMTQFSFTRYTDENDGNKFDRFGRPLAQTQIACPRGWRKVDEKTAEPYLATRTCTVYAAPIDAEVYIHASVAKTTSYEIVKTLDKSISDLVALKDSSTDLKIIGQSLNFYDGEAFVGLPLGQIGKFGAITRTESLVLTDEILKDAYGTEIPPYLEPTDNLTWTDDYPLEFRRLLPRRAGYTFHAGSADPADPRGYFVNTVRRRYDFQTSLSGRGLVLETLDPLHDATVNPSGHRTLIEYDKFHFLPTQVTVAAGLIMQVTYDYRVLQPSEVTDHNGNTSLFAFSPLGLLASSLIRGKNPTEGDQIHPSVRMEHEFLAFENSPTENRSPIFVRTIRHLHHDSEPDVPPGEGDETITTVEYSDGVGRLLQTRTQGEEERFGDEHFGGGEAVLPTKQSGGAGGDLAGRRNTDEVKPNVVVSGWQIYDNKGKVVEKYEPFFSEGWDYGQPDDSKTGQKVSMFYDPRGHAIRTLNPDGSEQQVIFGVPGVIASPDLAHPEIFEPTPWEAYTYDANDNAGRTHPEASSTYRHHWNTPSSLLIDALGRTIKMVERNRDAPINPGDPVPPVQELITRTTYDIRGNVLTITDALGREAFNNHVYDYANRNLLLNSIDAGLRKTVLDAAGGVIEQRDSKRALRLHAYDNLNRPIRLWARDGEGQNLTMRERLEYGDAGAPDQTDADRQVNRAANRLGKLFHHFDEAGLLSFAAYDFKGNLLEKTRRVVSDAAILKVFNGPPPVNTIEAFRVDWTNADPGQLDATSFASSVIYDALNRVKLMTYPVDVENTRRKLRPVYNHAGALEKVVLERVAPDGGTISDTFVERIAYNAKGQRALIAYGNGILTRYAYDSQTLRLQHLRTERYSKPSELTYHPAGEVHQELAYEYDLLGNILAIHDRTPGCGLPVTPDQLDRAFTYDALSRLRFADGRECDTPPPILPDSPRDDAPRCTDMTRTRKYAERYEYDAVGNILQLNHTHFRADGSTQATNRSFTLAPNTNPNFSLLANTNRLQRVTFGNQPFDYTYDVNGNMIGETSSRHFEWDHADRMKVYRTQPDGSEPTLHAHYLYDAGGQRVKKLIRKQGGQVEVKVYIDGAFEFQRIVQGGVIEENNTLHVMDGQSRIALMRVGQAFTNDSTPAVKYHLGDHLGSSNVVTDRSGNLVNREEYTPYGETSFGSFARKRYRFNGKERDEESGLSYFGFRYFSSWVGRWISCDPLGYTDGINPYTYVHDNPLNGVDSSGLETESTPREQAAAMSSTELHTEGPPPAPKTDSSAGSNYTSRYPAGESTLASHESGLIWTKNKQPEIDLLRARMPRLEESIVAPCMSDSPRAVGARVGDCRGVIAMTTVYAGGGAAVAGYEAVGTMGLHIAVRYPGAVLAGTVITAGINGNTLPGMGTTASVAQSEGAAANRLSRFFYDPRNFKTEVSPEYWLSRSADGASLHHWLIPQRAGWVPQGIRNAGFNMVELPAFRGVFHRSLGLNQWMGFARNWGPGPARQAALVENGIRLAIPGSIVGGGAAGGYVGYKLAEPGPK